MRKSGFLCLLAMMCACGPKQALEPFSKLQEEFVYTSLAYSPVSATQVGYHNHNGVQLDYMLDDYSPPAIEEQRRWLQGFRLRLQKSIDPDRLSPDDRADHDILQDQISVSLLEIDTIQNYRHNPTVYVELIGNALYNPFILEYTDKPTRFRQIISRMEKTPKFLDQARRNLESSPEIWTTVAQSENDGNIALVDQEMRAGVPPELRADYDRAAAIALPALRSFNSYLKNDLSQRPYDWRLGSDNYAKKFRYVLATDQSPQQVLASAEAELAKVHEQMRQLALPKTVPEALSEIAQKHATPETYFADARRDLEEATDFVKAKDLLTLPRRANLQVIETPEFMRGIYSVGGFNAAPALEPQLGAFYWITPIPKDWPKERVESKLREYNFYGLKLLTLHEAMPGHYVQQEFANDIQPPLRRIFRTIYGSGAYVEGWAVYATELMLDQGYLNNDPALRLTFLKQQLRVISNTILDIRLQTMGMTDQQALDLMLNEAFQEKEEANGKLRRAKLSSTQLPTYFVGWRDWHRLRDRANLPLKEFHERSLKAGALPLPVLCRMLTGKSL